MSSPPAPPPALRRGFAVVDVETSGLDPARHRVIEVAVTQVAPDGEIEQVWSSLVRAPGGTGPSHIHGLTPAHVRDAPRFDEVCRQVSELLDGRILVAHNAAFDWAFLAAEAARCGVDLPVRERLCTVTLARQLQVPAANLKLGTLAEHWGIEVDQAHRAGDDVRVLVEVLARCLDEAERQGAPLPLEECHPTTGWRWRARALLTRLRRLSPARHAQVPPPA